MPVFDIWPQEMRRSSGKRSSRVGPRSFSERMARGSEDERIWIKPNHDALHVWDSRVRSENIRQLQFDRDFVNQTVHTLQRRNLTQCYVSALIR